MTTIEWTDVTWNPVTGCSKISQGCKNCYAKQLHDMRHKAYESGKKMPEQYATPFEVVKCHAYRLQIPLRWRHPRLCFVNSMADLFHEDVPDEFIDGVFAVMGLAHYSTFQVLTKRADRMREYMALSETNNVAGRVADIIIRLRRERGDEGRICPLPHLGAGATWWPLPNVWLGVSVEDQTAADVRIPALLQTPAAVRFLSVEPMLGSVSLRWKNSTPFGVAHPRHLKPLPDGEWSICTDEYDGLRELDWVICGGESGRGARRFEMEWAEWLLAQCRAADVPFFMKQVGSNFWDTYKPKDSKGGDPAEWPPSLRVREFPKPYPGHTVRRLKKKEAAA
jgi:protein gp37